MKLKFCLIFENEIIAKYLWSKGLKLKTSHGRATLAIKDVLWAAIEEKKWLCRSQFLEEGSQGPNMTLFIHLHGKNSKNSFFSMKILIPYHFMKECGLHRHPWRAAFLRF
jgi:hypothetical protein